MTLKNLKLALPKESERLPWNFDDDDSNMTKN